MDGAQRRWRDCVLVVRLPERGLRLGGEGVDLRAERRGEARIV